MSAFDGSGDLDFRRQMQEQQRQQTAANNRVGPSSLPGQSYQGQAGTPWYMDSQVDNVNDPNRDADYVHAANLQRFLNGDSSYRGDALAYAGTDHSDTVRSALNQLLSRSANRKGLRDSLSAMPGMEQNEEGLLKRDANEAMGQGLKSTRQNFNQRGLLYSGLREGGETKVRAQAAGTLASGIASTRQDYAKATDAKQQALAALGLADEKEKTERANALFETTMKNSIARQQAFQQLGEGVGYAAGAYYGSRPTAPVARMPSGFENGFAGTGASDGYGGTQLGANNYDFSRTS